MVENRTALIGIVIEDKAYVKEMNGILHSYGEYIFGRMGVPHPEKDIAIISVAVEAPADIISALSGKLGALAGINTKTIYAKKKEK